jgi:hypothetical protein
MHSNPTRAQLFAARDNRIRLEAGPSTAYAGESVEYRPRKDEANGHPDFYAWHVVGRPDYARVSALQLVTP